VSLSLYDGKIHPPSRKAGTGRYCTQSTEQEYHKPLAHASIILFSFLTTESNVRPIHAKAMPVLLTTEEDCDRWLAGTIEEAVAL
jgi:putative SOS response-associated peptidase YedK